MIRVKRAYEAPATGGGARYLVDQLWPRGIRKETLKIESWLRGVAPSKELRQWFGHDPAKWEEFERRYFAELDKKPESWKPLLDAAKEGDVTLVFGARDTEHNNAVALKNYLERRLRTKAHRAKRSLAVA